LKYCLSLLLPLLCSCSVVAPVPPSQIRKTSFQNLSVIAPPVVDPPPGVCIPIPVQLLGQPSDFSTATNLAGPWVYRTDDLVLMTNQDGTTSGSFTNSPPGLAQEFYLIVPVDGPFPLPQNIVTNLN
jgi:hypothetical protein